MRGGKGSRERADGSRDDLGPSTTITRGEAPVTQPVTLRIFSDYV
jgi:hypothetical protein